MIPKNIYVFWHQDRLPLVTYKLFLSLKKKHPDFKVSKFSDKDVLKIKDKPEFFNTVLFKDKTRVSDWLRIYLLYHYGGVWIDINCFFLNKSLNDIIDFSIPKVQGFNLFRDICENWMIASPPKNKLMELWLHETEKCLHRKYNYCIENGHLYDNSHPLANQLPHLAQHLAFFKVVSEHNLEEDYLSLGKAGDKNNPLSVLKEHNWNTKKTVSFILTSENINPELVFIKFRGPERRNLISRIQKKEYNPKSYFVRALNLDNHHLISKKKKKYTNKHYSKKNIASK